MHFWLLLEEVRSREVSGGGLAMSVLDLGLVLTLRRHELTCVVAPGTSPLYRYRKGSLLGSERPSLLTFWMDDHEAKSKKDRPYRYR